MDVDGAVNHGTTSEVSISGDSSEGSPTLSPKANTSKDGTQKMEKYPPISEYENLKIIQSNGQIRELQTILRDM